MIPTVEILIGDARTRLRQIPAESVQTIMTSPPYWRLRNYETQPEIWGGETNCKHEWKAERQRAAKPDRSIEGKDANGSGTFGETRGGQASKEARGAAMQFGQSCRCGAWLGELGLEPTPELFIEHSLEVFAECWRVLKKDGTMWVNYGDSYINTPGNARGGDEREGLGNGGARPHRSSSPKRGHGLKTKDLVGMPWRMAFGLQQAGWYLRQDIIWHKPNPMPESVRDRFTKAHEYIFLLSKSSKYYFDQEAIQEPADYAECGRESVPRGGFDGKNILPGKEAFRAIRETRNKRSVWKVPTSPYEGAHFAVFPPDLIRPCILAGSRQGDTVLDIFAGSGTTGQVALEYGRHALLIDVNPANQQLMIDRLTVHLGQAVLPLA